MNIKKYDLKINEDVVKNIKDFFENDLIDNLKISLNIDISRNLAVKLNLKDIGYNENRALEFTLDTGFAKYVNIFTSFYDLFNLIEIRRENETIIFKPILSDEITKDYMIERFQALNEIKEKEHFFHNLILVNDFNDRLELFEVLYLFLRLPKNIKKDTIELLKEKLAYYGYDEDNIILEGESIDDIEDLVMNLALIKLYKINEFNNDNLSTNFIFTLFAPFLECYYADKTNEN